MATGVLTAAAVVSAFAAGIWTGARHVGEALDELGARVGRLERGSGEARTEGRRRPGAGWSLASVQAADAETGEAALVDAVSSRLAEEMGLLSLEMMRQRQRSFAELYATGPGDETTYGTASYLGGGYFLTVKHAVASSGEPGGRIRLRVGDSYVPATVVDAGNAEGEVDPGDWAILKADGPLAMQPLRVDLHYAYPFADPVARMGNDYSRGIMVTTGHVGQHRNGLVTCLTDGHPGVSGGGVLNRAGDLVGIQVGRLDGDFRFSFILPLRSEMFRRLTDVPLAFAPATSQATAAVPDTRRVSPNQATRSVATGGTTER